MGCEATPSNSYAYASGRKRKQVLSLGPRKRVDYFCSFFFILQGFLALFQCPKILFFLPSDLPHFGSILGLVHTLVHTSKKFISRMSRGHKFYSRVKITFSVTSRSKFFAKKEEFLWQALPQSRMEPTRSESLADLTVPVSKL